MLKVDCNRGRQGGSRPRVSLVVPVLNEAKGIRAALTALFTVRELHEVIIVDGGSTDGTYELVSQNPQVVAIRADKGRATQMNAGANHASGDVLLFLHADVTLPADAVECVRRVLSRSDVVAGAFRTWTVAGDDPPWWAPLLHLADLRSRYSTLPYGDQAIFVRNDVFRAVGGFPSIPLMEDLELSLRLRRLGRIKTARAHVFVSGRRFLARPLFYAVVMNLFPLLYRLGVQAATLARIYGQVR